MLVSRNGDTWGTLSGGCLEQEVATRAVDALANGKAELISFELGDDDVVLGFGTGCDGSVHVLIQPILDAESAQRHDVLETIRSCLSTRRTAVIATVLATSGEVSTPIGYHCAVDAATTSHDPGGDTPHNLIVAAALKKLSEDSLTPDGHPSCRWQSAIVETDRGRLEILLELLPPPIQILVFGDGHDVRPLVAGARSLGWQSTVVGRRPVEVLTAAIPDADDHVFLMHPDRVLERISHDGRTAAVVMTHNYSRDASILHELLFKSAMPYIGMLGPADRTNAMLNGFDVDEARRSRLFAPVGLDIATETPEEIALSICSEIQAVLHGRAGVHLRDRPGPIHN